MSDSDYIPAGERDDIMGWFQQRQPNKEAWDNALAIEESHAVADSVMRELAEALRVSRNQNGCDSPYCDIDHATGTTPKCRTCAALARFDALGGGEVCDCHEHEHQVCDVCQPIDPTKPDADKVGVVMPSGIAVSNVYEAYAEGVAAERDELRAALEEIADEPRYAPPYAWAKLKALKALAKGSNDE